MPSMATQTIAMDDQLVPILLDLGMWKVESLNFLGCFEGTLGSGLTFRRLRSSRGKKEVGVIGQASWISSVINLVNTSMSISPFPENVH